MKEYPVHMVFELPPSPRSPLALLLPRLSRRSRPLEMPGKRTRSDPPPALRGLIRPPTERLRVLRATTHLVTRVVAPEEEEELFTLLRVVGGGDGVGAGEVPLPLDEEEEEDEDEEEDEEE